MDKNVTRGKRVMVEKEKRKRNYVLNDKGNAKEILSLE